MGRAFLFIFSFSCCLFFHTIDVNAGILSDCGKIIRLYLTKAPVFKSKDWPEVSEDSNHYIEELDIVTEQLRTLQSVPTLFSSPLKKEAASRRAIAFMNYLKSTGEEFSILDLDNNRQIIQIIPSTKTRLGLVAAQLALQNIKLGFEASSNIDSSMSYRGRSSKFMVPFMGTPFIFISTWILDSEDLLFYTTLDHELIHDFFDRNIAAGKSLPLHSRFYRSGKQKADDSYSKFWSLEEILVPLLQYFRKIDQPESYLEEVKSDLLQSHKLAERWKGLYKILKSPSKTSLIDPNYLGVNFKYAAVEYQTDLESGTFYLPLFGNQDYQTALENLAHQINRYDEVIQLLIKTSPKKLVGIDISEIIYALENQNLSKKQVNWLKQILTQP